VFHFRNNQWEEHHTIVSSSYGDNIGSDIDLSYDGSILAGSSDWGQGYVKLYSLCVPQTISYEIERCNEPYVWVDGNTYNSSGYYSFSSTDTNGCETFHQMTISFNYINNTLTEENDTIYGIDNNGDSAIYQWINCDQNIIIPNEITSYLPNPLSGEYSLIISDEGCVDTSACFSYIQNTTSIGNSVTDFELGFFPNPVEDKIYFKNTPENVLVFDQFGRKMVEINHVNTHIDLSYLTSGLYLIEIDGKSYRLFKN